jgi:tetratricopeptide (TPR) repeat protein
MVMEYIKNRILVFVTKRICTLITLLLSIAVVQGCGSNLSKSADVPVYKPSSVTEQSSTLTFIPKLKVDKEGKIIPYKASLNPYLKKKSTIDKASVEKFIVAKRALKSNDIELAEKNLLEILETNKKLSGPLVLLSDIAVERNDLEKAENYLSRAIAINKSNVNAYLRLAKVKRKLGNFKEAQQTYFDVLSIWPDFPEAHLNLGILYDVYMNENLKAQKHVEAYQFLTKGTNAKVAIWLQEIQQRTGVPAELSQQTVIAQGASLNIR